eukprot:CFRG6273T1
MGVTGLHSHIEKRGAGKTFRFCPVVGDTVTKRIICVDGCGYIRRFCGQKVGQGKNFSFNYQWDFEVLRCEIAQYVRNWDACGFRLIVFIDAGVDDCKIDTWEMRRRKSMLKMKKMSEQLLLNKYNQALVDKNVWTPPPTCAQRMGEGFEAAGCRVIYCKQEADKEIVSFYRKHKCYAVLGSDSDFFVMPIGLYLDLATEKHKSKTGDVVIQGYHRKDVLRILGLRDDQLSWLAALVGNDYVSRSKSFEKNVLLKYGTKHKNDIIECILAYMREKGESGGDNGGVHLPKYVKNSPGNFGTKGSKNRRKKTEMTQTPDSDQTQRHKCNNTKITKPIPQYMDSPVKYDERTGSLREWVQQDAYNLTTSYPTSVGVQSSIVVKVSTGKMIISGFHADFSKQTFGVVFKEVRQAIYSRMGLKSVFEIYPVLNVLEESSSFDVQNSSVFEDDEVMGEVIVIGSGQDGPVDNNENEDDNDNTDMLPPEATKLVTFVREFTVAKHHPALAVPLATTNRMQMLDSVIHILLQFAPGYITSVQARAFRAQLFHVHWAAATGRNIRPSTIQTTPPNIHAVSAFLTLYDCVYAGCETGLVGMWALLSVPVFHYYCQNVATLQETEAYISSASTQPMIINRMDMLGIDCMQTSVYVPPEAVGKVLGKKNVNMNLLSKINGLRDARLVTDHNLPCIVLTGTPHALVEARSDIELRAFSNQQVYYTRQHSVALQQRSDTACPQRPFSTMLPTRQHRPTARAQTQQRRTTPCPTREVDVIRQPHRDTTTIPQSYNYHERSINTQYPPPQQDQSFRQTRLRQHQAQQQRTHSFPHTHPHPH